MGVGGCRKIQIRLCSMIMRSSDIVLSRVYLFLHYLYPNDIDTARQNDMI